MPNSSSTPAIHGHHVQHASTLATGNDLISAPLAAEIEGERLTDIELLGFCILLLIAGNETTTNLIGNAILCFDEHPEVYDQLRDAPELLPSAIEEALRYRSPVQAMFCIGAPLARLEARIALSAMLNRLRDIRRVPETQLEPLRSFIVYGVRHLPITFQPA